LACWCSDSPNWERPEEAKRFITKHYSESVIVFSGEVIEKDTFYVKIKTDKIWKGEFKREVILSTGAKKRYVGAKNREEVISISSCDYKFDMKKNILYLQKLAKGDWSRADATAQIYWKTRFERLTISIEYKNRRPFKRRVCKLKSFVINCFGNIYG